MIEALDRVGVIHGNSHEIPNWHHYSLKQRIDFLQQVSENPKLAALHDKKVCYSLLLLFSLLFILLLTLGIL